MNTRSYALRLADELEDMTCLWSPSVNRARVDKAAAELRRLHAENERLHQTNEAFSRRQEWWNEKMFALESQRDALLEVLKYLDKEFRQHGRQHWPEAVRVAAAIKAVEETK